MAEKTRLSIKEWPEDERPREKAARNGISTLSNAELLAILIGTGSTDESAVEIMRKVLASCGDSMAKLAKLSIDDLCLFKGIGPAKAITIVAVCELWKRYRFDEMTDEFTVRNSESIYQYFQPLMCSNTVEESYMLLVNNQNRVIKHVKLSTGGLTATVIDVRVVMREAIINRATAIAICHNHPSGSLQPSNQDNAITVFIQEACNTMNIRFLDHIIYTDKGYFSYCDEGRL